MDTNKNGVVGREELKESMRKFDVEIDDAVIDRLMKRCADTDAMSMQEFKVGATRSRSPSYPRLPCPIFSVHVYACIPNVADIRDEQQTRKSTP